MISGSQSARTSLATELSFSSSSGNRLSFNNKLLKSMTSFYRKSTNRDSVSSIITNDTFNKEEQSNDHITLNTNTADDDDDALTSLSVNQQALKIAKNRVSQIPVSVNSNNGTIGLNSNGDCGNITENDDNNNNNNTENGQLKEKHAHRKRVSDIISRLSASSTASSRAKQQHKSNIPKRSPIIITNSSFKSSKRGTPKSVSSPNLSIPIQKDQNPAVPIIPPNLPTSPITQKPIQSISPKSQQQQQSPVSPTSPVPTNLSKSKPVPSLKQRPGTPLKSRSSLPLKTQQLTPLKARPNTPVRRPISPTKNRPLSPLKSRPLTPVLRSPPPKKLSKRPKSIPVQELKSKIMELESVLSQERSKYELEHDRIDRVSLLEQRLTQEHEENARLQAHILRLEQQTSLPSNKFDDQVVVESNKVSAPSENSVKSTEYTSSMKRQSLQQSEYKHQSLQQSDYKHQSLQKSDYKQQYYDLQGLFSTQLAQFQSIISELKVQKKTLCSKNTSLTSEIDSLRIVLENNQLKFQKLEHQLNVKQAKIESLDNGFKTSQESLQMALRDLKKKNAEINDLNSSISMLTKQTSLYLSNVQALEKEVEMLNTKILRDSWSYSKQYNVQQRELRRKNCAIVSLETALQDAKISLEEKEMENDELNNSIMKLMERTNQAIEDVKRSSTISLSM